MQFSKYLLEMLLDRMFAHLEFQTDLPIRFATSHSLHDIVLAGCQPSGIALDAHQPEGRVVFLQRVEAARAVGVAIETALAGDIGATRAEMEEHADE